jgi:hypothetical protein
MATEEARLALTRIQVDRRAADLYVYDDRLVVATDTGERAIPMARLERVATRRTWRGSARILLALTGDEIVEVRGLKQSSATVAHRTIVAIARDFH